MTNRPRRTAGSRNHPQSGTPQGAFEEAKSEIEALRDEMQEWQGNLEGNSMEHLPKYDEVTECVDALENAMSELESAEGEDWPEALNEVTVNWTIDARKSAGSRGARMGNALNTLSAAIDGVRQREESSKEEDKDSEEHEEQITTAGNIADYLEAAQSEAENVNFPGMF